MQGKGLVLTMMCGLAMLTLAAAGCGEKPARPETPAAPGVVINTATLTSTGMGSVTMTLTPAQVVEGPIETEVVKTATGWEMQRGGQPFLIKGVGGDFDKQRLVAIGGNAYRTWGPPSVKELDEAAKLGLCVCVGISLGNNADAINGALPEVQRIVTRLKDNPAVLMWGIGNEMERANANDPALWQALDKLAAAAKKIDPNHPTMTVIAEMGAQGEKIGMIEKYCPNIDIVGVNSYAGAANVPDRYKKAGGTKPFVLTEYGPPGQWESKRTAWRASFELTSTEKGDMYRKAWTDGIVAAKGLSLGGFAFLWGNKNESTVTWYGMMLPDGSNLEPIEALAKEWGKPLANRCPKIKSLKVDGEPSVAPGAGLKAAVEAVDPDGDKLSYEWVLRGDSRDNRYGGGARAEVEALTSAIARADGPTVEVKLPAVGPYRLFVYIRDGKGNAAVGNVPLQGQ